MGCGVGDLGQPNYRSHVRDYLYQPMKMAIVKKFENVTKLLCMLRPLQLTEQRIYHIIIYSCHKVTHNGFFSYLPLRKISNGELLRF